MKLLIMNWNDDGYDMSLKLIEWDLYNLSRWIWVSANID